MSNSKINLQYNKAIYSFEEGLLKYINNSNVDRDGYLINLNDYENLKKNTKYDKKNYMNYIKQKSVALKEEEKIYNIEQIRMKTSQYLLNMIYNENRYILINTDLWKVIGKKGKEKDIPFSYKVENKNIILKIEKNKKLTFKQEGNIIDIKTYSSTSDKANIEEINQILKDINVYYNFENKFISRLKGSKSSQKMDYLVTKKWFDKWINNSNYENIKNSFLEKNKSEHEIKNELIYYHEINKVRYSELNPIEITSFKNKNELESFLGKDSLIIIPSNFLQSFKEDNNIKYTRYYIYDEKIEIIFNDSNNFIEKSKNNIIQIKKENENIISNNNTKKNTYNDNNITSIENNNLKHLKQLIKIFYFEEKLKKQIKSEKKSLSKDKMINNKIYIINKNLINEYKDYFDYNKLNDLLNKNLKIKDINYDNLEDNFDIIIGEIKKDNKYFDFIKKKELSSEFMKDNNIVNQKKLEVNNPQKTTLNYYTDFLIINEDINSFFIEKNIIQKNQNNSGYYLAGDNKLILFYGEKYSFQIGYLDSNGDFINEYLINAKSKDYNKAIYGSLNLNSIKDLFQNYFKEKDQFRNDIGQQKNIFGYYYKINENENQNSNKSYNPNKENNTNIAPNTKDKSLFDYFYNYKSNINYKEKNYINYYDYLSYDKINISMNLYFNYENIERKIKIKNSSPLKEKYYLINKELMIDIKRDNYFKKIYELLNLKNIKEDDENNKINILLAIKELSEDELEKYKEKSTINYSKGNYIPNLTEIMWQYHSIMIYEYFEIIQEKYFNSILINDNDISKMRQYCLDCILNEDKIIIDYPNNMIGILVIGKLDYDYSFINEYILIYKTNNYKYKHLDKIKGRLNNYIEKIESKLYNYTTPIIDDDDYNEIGTFIKYQQHNQLNNNNYKLKDFPSKDKAFEISNNSDFKNKQDYELFLKDDSLDLKNSNNLKSFKNITISDNNNNFKNKNKNDFNKDEIISNQIIEKNFFEEFEKYKTEINMLKIEIEKLKNEKENEIKNINKLNEEIIKLKNVEKEFYLLRNENKKLKNEINDIYLILEDYKKYKIKSKELFEKLLNKKEELNELSEKLSRYPIELDEGEKLLSFTIFSSDENIMINIICKNTDKFYSIENKLYKEYPEYFENEYYFTVNGEKINSDKNFDENKIHNNNIIILKNKKYKSND